MARASIPLAIAALALQGGLVAAGIQDLPGHEWIKPGAGDLRSPCPGLNVLANHGYLPRTGRNITRDLLYNNIQAVYNLDNQMASFFADSAVRVLGPEQPEITLADLDKHDSIEHDASLTRDDARTGDNHTLQPRLLAALLADATEPNLSIESLAKSRNRRFKESQDGGSPPLSVKMKTLAYGESALILQALGTLANSPDGSLLPPKEAVQTWIGEERLPTGWKRPNVMSLASTISLSGKVQVSANTQSGGALGFLATAPLDLLGSLAGGAATLASKVVGAKRGEAQAERYYGHGMWA